MTEIVSKMEQKLSKAIKDIPSRFFKRNEIACSDQTKFEVISQIKQMAIEMYENINTIDGVKIDFPDSRALIRASNTSPILCLSIEATDQQRLDELETEMTKLIKKSIQNVYALSH